jgi:hypothetical protein
MEGVIQIGVHCMHVWKCHNKTAVQLLYTNKMLKNKNKYFAKIKEEVTPYLFVYPFH